MRPRRSVLFMPGSNTRAMLKARTLPADALVFDLEDAVAPDAKEEARRQVVEALGTGGYGRRELAVRINALATPWGAADLAAVAGEGPAAVLIPKVESPDMVRDVETALEAHRAPETLALWCMLETPRGILSAAAIAGASRRIAALVLGTSDLTKELRARHTRDRLPLIASLELTVLAARAAGVSALDGVHLDLEDDAGFAAACRQAADLGFDGKSLIHPKTIAVANEVFAPSAADLDRARRTLRAHAEAQAQGRGVAVLDGRLVENLHVEEARRLLGLAEAIEALDHP